MILFPWQHNPPIFENKLIFLLLLLLGNAYNECSPKNQQTKYNEKTI